MKLARALVGVSFAIIACPAFAGPPYLTDDPVPTETKHWEIYAFSAGEARHSTLDADAGFDLNYGPIKDVQLTTTLPLSFSHAPAEGRHSGIGDVELGVKFRFFHDEGHGLSAAIFPRAILPTASHSSGEETCFFLPLWLGKDFAGGTSIFGGGGYMINSGAGNRSFWQAALAVTQDLNKKVSAGAEVTHQGADTVNGTAQTRVGLGMTVQLLEHYAILFSGGPTWADHQTNYHFYIAVGLNF